MSRRCLKLALRLGLAPALWPAAGIGGGAAGPIGSWLFDDAHVKEAKVAATTGTLNATVAGTVRLAKDPPAIVLDGTTNSISLHQGAPPAMLPNRAMTLEATVAIDRPIEWGGILGFIQDNGNFEKGWLLGTRHSKFLFALSTAGANDGDGKLTYLMSATDFEPGRWYHVAATYDGTTQRLYVDGKLEATATAQRGDVLYPKSSFLVIGSYRDSNEHYRLPCRIHEVSLYGRARSATEVRAAHDAKRRLLPRPLELADGPYLRFPSPGTATLTFRTAEPGTVAVEYGETLRQGRRVASANAGSAHRVPLDGLKPDATYEYRIASRGKSATAVSRIFRFDTTSRVAPPSLADVPAPWPADELTPLYEQTAKWIVKRTGVTRGFCLVLGCGDGRLAFELAKRTELSIVGIEPDPTRLDAARRALDRAGAYGVRVSVHPGPLSALPAHFANLIVSDRTLTDGQLPATSKEVIRLLRPYGGVACLGQPASFARGSARLDQADARRWASADASWKTVDENGLWLILERGALPDTGDWTHMYADAGNTACSGDRLAGGPVRLQWFGRPGPRLMVDRHHRTMAPLAKSGRLFVLGSGRILAVDVYNGTPLWDVGIEGSQRVAAPKDTSTLALADDLLYVATGARCVALEVETGRLAHVFPTPQLVEGKRRVWGYLATTDGLLFGTGRKEQASLRRQARSVVDAQYGDFKDIATSDYLVCLDRHSGRRLWSRREGVIVDPAIGISGGRVFLVESTSPNAAKDPDGRMKLDVSVGRGARLVALGARSGKPAWTRPIDGSAFQHIIHLVATKGVVLLVGSKNKANKAHYDLFAFDATSGRPLWHREQTSGQRQGGTHGEQVHHPAVVGDVVHAEPFAYHLRTGEPVAGWTFNRGGHGCGTTSASATALFYRAGNPTMFDLRTRRAAKLSRVSRPGCWINIVPACGLILIPEASSGCSCAFPLQTSMAFAPK